MQSLKASLRRRFARLKHRSRACFNLRRPMVSFCFDQAPASAADVGAALLDARDVKGTYFVCGGMVGKPSLTGCNATPEQLGRLLASGHEIACHTLSHLDCGEASVEWIDEEVTKNRWAFAELGAPNPSCFAYPSGQVSARAKGVLSGRFALLRGQRRGLVVNGCDLNQAPAVAVEGPNGEAIARRWIQRAIRERAWLILYTHDVAEAPSPKGCTPAALGRLLDQALEGGARIVSVSDGCRRIGALGGRSRGKGWTPAGTLSRPAPAHYARR